jgi:octaprenyl-diphosphate synthase
MNEVSESSGVLLVKFDDYRVKVDNAISAELNRLKDSIFFTPLKNALKGGKRLRPISLILSYESVGSQKMNPLPAAVAVELAHTESLIHDDIIDRDPLRRETSAFHALNGYEMALLSADFILSIILDITARYTDPRITLSLAKSASRMCEGELEEYSVIKKGKRVSVDRYIKIIYKKTASLFEASAMIGAIIGGAAEDEVKALLDYGRLIGIAYQIKDDISDFDDSETTNILSLLDTNAGRTEILEEMSATYILEAKQRLEKLGESGAKALLVELADFVRSNSIKGFL